MSSEIWQIGQQCNAQDLYKQVKDGINIGNLGDVMAVKLLTNICNTMTATFNEVIADQNEYLIEIEDDAADFTNLKDDIDEKLEKLYKEIKELEKKEQNGTITEEEKKELEAKQGELKSLMKESDSKIKEKTEEFKAKDHSKLNELNSKISVAKNYGEVTIDKGELLAESKGEVKTMICGVKFSVSSTDETGDLAIKAGEDLLDEVDTATGISEKINKNYQVFKNI